MLDLEGIVAGVGETAGDIPGVGCAGSGTGNQLDGLQVAGKALLEGECYGLWKMY